jgi:hypothetical protein
MSAGDPSAAGTRRRVGQRTATKTVVDVWMPSVSLTVKVTA